MFKFIIIIKYSGYRVCFGIRIPQQKFRHIVVIYTNKNAIHTGKIHIFKIPCTTSFIYKINILICTEIYIHFEIIIGV